MTTQAAQDGRLALSAHALATELAKVIHALDTAHAHGLAIPPAAGEAAATLGALVTCWESNSRGRPAPTEAKAMLGLVPAEPSRYAPGHYDGDGCTFPAAGHFAGEVTA